MNWQTLIFTIFISLAVGTCVGSNNEASIRKAKDEEAFKQCKLPQLLSYKDGNFCYGCENGSKIIVTNPPNSWDVNQKKIEAKEGSSWNERTWKP